MKIRYFDLGLHKGEELIDMQKFLPSITNDFEIYGFEAAPTHFNNYCKKLANQYTNVYNFAITNKHKSKIKLYYAHNKVGHSIHGTKQNITQDKFWSVDTIKFSDWLSDNNINLKDSFNIIKINIEGAEWEFFNDIVDSNLNKHINIFCGAGHDVEKIKNFVNDGTVKKYYDLLKENNIILHRWVLSWKIHKNIDLHKMIKDMIN